MKNKPILFNMNASELEQFVVGLGAPKFRAKQISEWLSRGAPDFFVMKNIPADLQKKLDDVAVTLPVSIEQKLESSDNQTTKFLLKLSDGQVIETVLMRTSYGNSVCVSSQAGCAMGCTFCASTLLGLKRNLTANEMIAQVLVATWQLRQLGIRNEDLGIKKDKKQIIPNSSFLTPHSIKPNGNPNNMDVTHIVVMGTGEPLQNTTNVFGFLEYANANLGISWRRITISTCGIVPGINKLIEWGRPVNLAISLHAPNDELRSKLMPINAKYNLESVLNSAFEFVDKTKRQLMIEYILLESEERRTKSEDINGDDLQLSTDNSSALCALRSSNFLPEHAEQLSKLLYGRNVMVNLIPWNPVDERQFKSPSGNAVHRFQDILIKNKIHTRIRRERGSDIGSACGQLRLRKKL